MGGNIPGGNVPGGGGVFQLGVWWVGIFLELFFLKVRLSPFQKICFICFNESPLKSWKMHFISSLKVH